MNSMSELVYNKKNILLYQGDCFSILNNIREKSVNMIFADPPYFLSNGGITCKSGKKASVDKGEWDKGLDVYQRIEYNKSWIKLCKKVLKDDGTIWISGTLHNIYTIGVALEEEGFSIINNITWQKPNPPPNLACRCFTHSTETIIWARKIKNGSKGKHYFNYELMKKINNGKQMKDVWMLQSASNSEKTKGYHPTQKSIALLERIILASTKEGDLVLDPFNGSGTTGVASIRLNRKYIGIEIEKKFINLSIERFDEEINNNLFLYDNIV